MENEKAVEKFDPSKLMDGVKDRIKATFVALIPDTQWETKKTTLRERIKGFFVFTKNCLTIFFQGLKEATGEGTCHWHLNVIYFKGEFAEQKRNDFAKNVLLLGKYYENNVRYDFHTAINTNPNTNISIGAHSMTENTTGCVSNPIGKNTSSIGV